RAVTGLAAWAWARIAWIKSRDRCAMPRTFLERFSKCSVTRRLGVYLSVAKFPPLLFVAPDLRPFRIGELDERLECSLDWRELGHGSRSRSASNCAAVIWLLSGSCIIGDAPRFSRSAMAAYPAGACRLRLRSLTAAAMALASAL